jgi:hypothetical protein
MQSSACASLAGRLADVEDGSDINKGGNNEVIELADNCLEDWNPFNGVTTPAGYAYCGKLVFICLGPASKFYCKILKTGGGNAKNKEKREKMHTAVFVKCRRKWQLWRVQFAGRGECPYRQK